jgi:predicted enzyme involved in methoxymalonyl-ACP biosynthesis
MLSQLVKVCKSKGIEKIMGYYYKTPKNSMVKNLYGDFGFKLVSLEADESSVWQLDVNTFKENPTYISIN